MNSWSHSVKVTFPRGRTFGNSGETLDLVELDESGNIPVVRIRGALDIGSAPAVNQRLLEAAATGAGKVNFDLSEVDFIDWAGLGVIAGALWRMRSSGGDVAITGVSRPVADAFAISRLAEIVEISRTEN